MLRGQRAKGGQRNGAVAKALVDGLHGQGVERIWSKLNRTNASRHAQEAPLDAMLLYIDAPSYLKNERRRGTSRKRGKGRSDPSRLFLFTDL